MYEQFLGEDELYQKNLVETMKEYGLIEAEEESLIESYLFQTKKASEGN